MLLFGVNLVVFVATDVASAASSVGSVGNLGQWRLLLLMLLLLPQVFVLLVIWASGACCY